MECSTFEGWLPSSPSSPASTRHKTKRFKEKHNLEKRRGFYKELKNSHPESILLIVEKRPHSLSRTLPDVSKKNAASADSTIGQFTLVIKNLMKIDPNSPNSALCLFIGNDILDLKVSMKTAYEKYKDEDGFLYITYGEIKETKLSSSNGGKTNAKLSFDGGEAENKQEEAEVQFNLGREYEKGLIGKKDMIKAIEMYIKAANQGHPKALSRLSKIASENTQHEKLIHHMGRKHFEETEHTEELAHRDVQYHLAGECEEATIDKRDKKKAVKLYIKAANQGHEKALFRLVELCSAGSEYVNEELLTKILTHRDSQYDLAKMYSKGTRVRKDKNKARELYINSASQGHPGAQHKLAKMYEKGITVEKDEERAVELYIKAANQGHNNARYRLGVMYGGGVEKNEEKALELYVELHSNMWLLNTSVQNTDSTEFFREEDLLGKGSSGLVYKIQLFQINWNGDKTPTHYAVKQSKTTNNNIKKVREEIQAMAKLPVSTHVVQVFGVLPFESLGVVMEYCDLGGFRTEILKHLDDQSLKIKRQLLHDCLRQVSAGMKHLHKHKVIHRDLALRNILWSRQYSRHVRDYYPMESNYCFKISDFGMSRIVEGQTFVEEDQTSTQEEELSNTGITTSQLQRESFYTAKGSGGAPVRWMPPESLRRFSIGKLRYSFKADVWSFGVTIWEVFCGDLPYSKRTNEEVVRLVVDKERRLLRPKHCEDRVWRIAKECFREVASERPSFDNILERLEAIFVDRSFDEIPICFKEKCTKLHDRVPLASSDSSVSEGDFYELLEEK